MLKQPPCIPQGGFLMPEKIPLMQPSGFVSGIFA